MKVVINRSYGGFGLSNAALLKYLELADIEYVEGDKGYGWSNITVNGTPFYTVDILRCDPHLVRVVELMGSDAWGSYAKLKIVEIPDDIDWQIMEYDGKEWVAEIHRTWH